MLVSAEILADGTVGSIKLKRSSGYAILDDSAVKAVKKWLFQPGQQLGAQPFHLYVRKGWLAQGL